MSEPARTALITGSTGAIGEAIARRLAVEHGFDVVLHARDRDRAEASVARIVKAGAGGQVRAVVADLSRPGEIRALAAAWTGPLHALVNNASTTPRRRTESEEGFEMQFAVNIMGYVRMTEAFAPILAAHAPARIVNVASYWAGDLDLTDLQFRRRTYDNNTAYRQSKQAERMLTVAYADRLAGSGITVNACHPGDVNSRLSNDLGFGGHERPDAGADTPVWLASAFEIGEATGRYYAHRRADRCRFGERRDAVQRLYEICTGIPF